MILILIQISLKKITKKTKAIMVVHLNGRSCDMSPIIRIAKKYRLKIIEDAAQALELDTMENLSEILVSLLHLVYIL